MSERLAPKHGADLVSLSERIDTTTAADKMVFRMLAVLAEFEHDQISERTKGALSHMRNQSKRISGRLPYGWNLLEDGTTLVPNPQEQEGLRMMLALRNAGEGRRRIAATLSKRNISTETGTAWSAQAVGAILKREVKLQRVVIPAVG